MPVAILNKVTIVQGTGQEVDFDLFDANGNEINMTDPDRLVSLSFQGTGAIPTETLVRLSSDSDQVRWRSQALGQGTWTFLAAETFVAGTYIVAVYFRETAEQLTPRWIGETIYKVVPPGAPVAP
ncbi:hypothetical protein DRQ50_12005 [bacterium]|nr:MAG: hypothetical protein DRQ50_12005 [bacterium]